LRGIVIGSGIWKRRCSEHKSCNISDAEQDTAKVTMDFYLTARINMKSYTRHRFLTKFLTLNDLYARFKVFVADMRENCLLIYLLYPIFAAMSTAGERIKRNQLPAHLHQWKFTAASRGFPATAPLSCFKITRTIWLKTMTLVGDTQDTHEHCEVKFLPLLIITELQ